MKKTNKVLAIILSLVMAMSFTMVSSAGETPTPGTTIIPTDNFTETLTGEKSITKTYSFTPSSDGGYLFLQTPSADSVSEGQEYSMLVHSKDGKSVYESSYYEKDVRESKIRVYLKANNEYFIDLKAKGNTMLAFKFSLSTTPVGSSVALIGAPSLNMESETTCTLYPFANRRAYAWYSFTAPKEGCFEFVINNNFDQKLKGDIVAELRDETFSPTEEEDLLFLYEGESDVLRKTMRAGEVCYVQIAEQYTTCLSDVYTVGITVKEHFHTSEIVVDDDLIMKACPCQSDDTIEYSFWLVKAGASNITYTGKTVTPKAKFTFLESFCKEGYKPEISSNAYKITLVGSNKKNIGTAKAKIKFVGVYKSLGTHYATFKIIPKGANLTLSAISAGFKAKWTRKSSKISGYELRYSANSDMSKAKTIKIANSKNSTKKISKLKNTTTYYARIRTYKTVSGKKYYSNWSEKQEVTTK